MKRITLTVTCACLMLSSCGTYTGSGALTGAHLGSILGSAIGGISGGPRGSDVGTLIGMAGGAAVGAAIGSAADKKSEVIYEYNDDYYNDSYSASAPRTFTPSTYRAEGYNAAAAYNSDLLIKNLRFVDLNRDNTLTAGEDCKIIFEVYNASDKTLYDVCPLVSETTGNRHIYLSPGIHVEQIAPGKGIRYTCMVHADSRLKNGTARFRIQAVQGNNIVTSMISEMDIETRRR